MKNKNNSHHPNYYLRNYPEKGNYSEYVGDLDYSIFDNFESYGIENFESEQNIQAINYAISNADKHDVFVDEVINRANKINETILPADNVDNFSLQEGSGSFERKSLIPRLRVTLLLLQNQFDVNIEDEDKLKLTKGMVSDSSMRKESYYSIEIPELDRDILICDEEGNATFVFDNKVLSELSITNDSLLRLTKSDLKALIEEYPQMGQKVIYSKKFLDNMAKAITSPYVNTPIIEKAEIDQKIHDDLFLSINDIANQMGISRMLVANIANEMADLIGEARLEKSGKNLNKLTRYYSPEQVGTIRKELELRGSLAENVPDGYLSTSDIARQTDGSGFLSAKTVKSVALDLSDKLGEIKKYKLEKAAGRITNCYSPEQVEIIQNELKDRGLVGETIPNDYMSLKNMADYIGVSKDILTDIILNFGDKIGKVALLRADGAKKPSKYYSPEQVKNICNLLEQKSARFKNDLGKIAISN